MLNSNLSVNRNIYIRNNSRLLLCFIALFSIICPRVFSQVLSSESPQQYYNAAQSAQSSGNMDLADREYKLFLVQSLYQLASDTIKIGDNQKAADLLDEALTLEPNNIQLLDEDAEASRQSGNLKKAESFALQATNLSPQSAPAHLALGRILLETNQGIQAKTELEAAVAIDPNYSDGLALAKAYLQIKEQKSADQIFSEMLKAYGNKANLHMDFGLAYVEAGYTELAISEFKQAILDNNRLPGAHYSLGACYIQLMGEIDYPKAEKEFHLELKVSPNDFLSYLELGNIDLIQHRYTEAESNLKHAAMLNPLNPDVFLSLGQMYSDTKKPLEAEKALRTCIHLTSDISRNHYQVQRAHYLLGRILLEAGNLNEAKKEMQISAQLLKESSLQKQGKSEDSASGMTVNPVHALSDKAEGENSNTAMQVAEFEKRISPAIADSYNNLGVISARSGNYKEALTYFENAKKWNPSLEGLDYNMGKAAFAAKECTQAISSLQHFLKTHRDSLGARSMLSVCQYQQKNYKGVVEILRPVQTHIQSIPVLEGIYMDSLQKSKENTQIPMQKNP